MAGTGGGGVVVPLQPSVAVVAAELRRKIAEVEVAARDNGVRLDLPEGKLMAGLLESVGLLARVVEAAGGGLERAAEKERVRVEALATALDRGVAQARVATVNLLMEKEAVLTRIMGETLPLFAKALQEALVIRERGWLEELRRRWVFGAVVLALALFGGGYAASAWVNRDGIEVARNCLLSPFASGGRVFCAAPTGIAEAVRAAGAAGAAVPAGGAAR